MSQIREGWIEEAISLHAKNKRLSNYRGLAPSDQSKNLHHSETKKVTFSDSYQTLADTNNEEKVESLNDNKSQSEGWTSNSVEINVVVSPRHTQNTTQAQEVPTESLSNSSTIKESNEAITSKPQGDCNNNDNLTDNQQLQEYQNDKVIVEHTKPSNQPVFETNDQDNLDNEEPYSNTINQDPIDCNDALYSLEPSSTNTNDDSQPLSIEVANQLVTIDEAMEQN